MSAPKIAVVCTARPSFAKLQPVCEALAAIGFDVDLIAAAYATTRNRGGVVEAMIESGHPPTTILHAALDANTGETSAITTGLLTIRLAQHFAQTRPAGVIVNHDRHETAAVAIAAAYQNIQLLHLGGGELSGSIDDKVRRLNTSLSDWHCVSNLESYGRVINQGAFIDRVWVTGCPALDVARQAHQDDPVTKAELDAAGTGVSVDPREPYAMVMMHPNTDHPETAVADLQMAIQQAGSLPLIVFWPGGDTGHDAASKWLRATTVRSMRLIRTLPPRRFLKLLSLCTLAVGNSSALIREGSYYGIPRIIVGDRQRGRAWTAEASTLYGDGYAAPKIAEIARRMVGHG